MSYSSDYKSLHLLCPDITEVETAVARTGQVEFEILEQFGFAIEVDSIDKNFYKIPIDLTQNEKVHDANAADAADASGTLIFNALKNTTVGYLQDISGSPVDEIEVGAWSASTLVGTSSGGEEVGQQIVKGILGPMFTDNWGAEGIGNESEVALASDHVESYNAAGTELDHKLAAGLAATLDSATHEAHDETIQHLLDQVMDLSANIGSHLEAARHLELFADNVNDVSANNVAAYANQHFWMKVYLKVTFDGTASSVTDYEDENLTGDVLVDDDDQGVASGDNKANLVKKTADASATTVFGSLQPKFLAAFKGEVTTAGGSTKVYNGAGTDDGVTIADSAELDNIRIPILFKFPVNA